jgi:hypothetical protein
MNLYEFMEKQAIKSLNVPLAGNTTTGRLSQVDQGDAGLHGFLDELSRRHGTAGTEIANKYRQQLPGLAREHVSDPKGYSKAHKALAADALREIVQKRRVAHQSKDPSSIRTFYDAGATAHGDNYKARLHNPSGSRFDDFMRTGTGKAVVGGTAVLGGALLARHLLKKKREKDRENQ